MAETYKVIFPGNWVNRLNAYPLPNADFIKNNRASGFWGDRQTQAVNYIPGWLAVLKTAYFKISTQGATVWNATIPSPYTRGDDKPLADIQQLVCPAGALLYRLGLRVPSIGVQPSYASQGPNNPYSDLASGLVGTTALDQLVLASAMPAAKNTGLIATNGGNTSNTSANASGVVPTGGNALTVRTDKTVPVGATAVTAIPGSANAAVASADRAYNLYCVDSTGIAEGDPIRSLVPGGLYVVAEMAFLVPDAVGTLDDLTLPGHQYAGYSG